MSFWMLRRNVPPQSSGFLQGIMFLSCGAAAWCGPWFPRSWGLQMTHNDAPQSVEFLWTSDQPDTESSTWQHTTLTSEKRIWLRRDSNFLSQKESSRWHTPQAALPLGPPHGLLTLEYKGDGSKRRAPRGVTCQMSWSFIPFLLQSVTNQTSSYMTPYNLWNAIWKCRYITGV
jgi:hypothetical protein